MHGVVAALVVAEEIDPATVRPSPLASVVFLFLLVSLILLLWSFVRHTRRAQANLGSARASAPTGPSEPGSAGKDEGDTR
jgi:hypothetical protein